MKDASEKEKNLATNKLLPPYSRVTLSGLVKNAELNGQDGVVLPENCSTMPAVPGCLKVRLESGREVAVKPQNVNLVVVSEVVAPPVTVSATASQEQMIQEVLAQLKTEGQQ